MRKGLSCLIAAVALLAAPAQAGCWNVDDASAATVRDLQSMLMVATLRCQVAGHDITADYNGFVQANRRAIGALNDRLKAHFIRAEGPVAGQTAYDSFTTTLANAYGAAASGGEVCEGMASLAREAAMMAGSAEGLLMLAGREGVTTRLPEGACAAETMTIASAAPAASPIVMASAGPAAAVAPMFASAAAPFRSAAPQQ